MKKLFFVFQMLALIYIYHAAILNVAINGSQDYHSIQSAIQASNNGDTVLVHPGRYYENVDFIGKSINLCSLEATSGDSSYIATTIIDGNNIGSCIRLVTQEQNVSLRGFTLENGTGYPFGSEAENHGGGILITSNCNVNITNCEIQNNKSANGAGIFIAQGSVQMSGVDIHDNYSFTIAGGLYVYSHSSSPTNITFNLYNRCSIYNNYGGNPCDIVIIDVQANLDIYLDLASVAQPSSFYIQRINNFTSTQGFQDTIYSQRAYREEVNHDIYVSPSGDDNNNGLSPAEAMKSITKAVHRIASDSLDVKAVHVLPGTYCEGDGDQTFPIPGKSWVNISGAGSEFCTLLIHTPASLNTLNVVLSQRNVSLNFHGFTITTSDNIDRKFRPLFSFAESITLSDVVIRDTRVDWVGAIYIDMRLPYYCTMNNIKVSNVLADERILSVNMSGSITNCTFENITSVYPDPNSDWIMTMFDLWARGSLRVDNCVFRNFNVAGNQPTLHISDPNQPTGNVDISISNCLFENLGTDDESPIGFNNRNVENFQVNNCTFINNRGTSGTVGLTGKIYMKNNIFYNPDSAHEIYLYPSAVSNVYLDYNNIRGGESSINNLYSNNHVYYADTNISTDPAFCSLDTESPFFAMLSPYSPCINSGIPDTTGVDILQYDLAGNWRIWNNIIDMGCYEYGSVPWVSNDDPVVPETPAIKLVAYPNPFKTSTNIKTSIPVECVDKLNGNNYASIDVYNIKGQKVKTISLDMRSSLEQVTVWDGRDQNGNNCATGIYFLNLTLDGKHVVNRKVTLIK